jgi:hypothetical protein
MYVGSDFGQKIRKQEMPHMAQEAGAAFQKSTFFAHFDCP